MLKITDDTYLKTLVRIALSRKQIRRELKIQIFPRQNYEPLDIKCNFQRLSSSESSLSLIQQKLEDPPDLTCCSCLLSKSQTY